MRGGGGWRLSPKVPHATPSREKGLQPDIRAARRFSLGRVRSCVFRRVHERDDDDEERRRRHTHENSGVERLRGRESPFGLKGEESLRMFEWEGDCRMDGF